MSSILSGILSALVYGNVWKSARSGLGQYCLQTKGEGYILETAGKEIETEKRSYMINWFTGKPLHGKTQPLTIGLHNASMKKKYDLFHSEEVIFINVAHVYNYASVVLQEDMQFRRQVYSFWATMSNFERLACAFVRFIHWAASFSWFCNLRKTNYKGERSGRTFRIVTHRLCDRKSH